LLYIIFSFIHYLWRKHLANYQVSQDFLLLLLWVVPWGKRLATVIW